jgi:hypothetical protein
VKMKTRQRTRNPTKDEIAAIAPYREFRCEVCGHTIGAHSRRQTGATFLIVLWVSRSERAKTLTTLNHAAEHIAAHRSPRISRASCADLETTIAGSFLRRVLRPRATGNDRASANTNRLHSGEAKVAPSLTSADGVMLRFESRHRCAGRSPSRSGCHRSAGLLPSRVPRKRGLSGTISRICSLRESAQARSRRSLGKPGGESLFPRPTLQL